MTRAVIAATPLPSPVGYASSGLDVITPGVGDTGTGLAAPHNGKVLIFAYNPTGGTLTATITSVADDKNRIGDITADPILAGKGKLYGPFPSMGWKQNVDGNIYFSGSAVGLLFTVIPLP